MRPQPLPLLVLAGFLGSGKTSTLRHWLAQTSVPLKRIAVIINDFGEINVDAALLARKQLELRSITGGCVCCQSFEDLVEQVETLARNPDYELVWIETSGLADPEEVLDHLSGPALQDSTVIRRVVLVLDASDFPCSWRGRPVQEEQIRYADVIVLNKIDRIEESVRQRIEISLRLLNPRAEIIAAQHGVVAPERLSEGGRIPAHVHDEDHYHDHGDHDHEHEEHSHDDEEPLPHSAATLFLPLEAPVERAAFGRFLGSLPSSVFRAKGFIRFSDQPDQLQTFQKVRDQSELLVLPLEHELEIAMGLVLIGPHLEKDQIQKLAGVLATTPASL